VRKGLIASYVAGITDVVHGESYERIARYFIPEFITALVLYSLPNWIDAYFIASLKSTATYGTLGATSNLISMIIKVAEGVSIGTIILIGRHNGSGNFKEVGKALRDAFWTTCLLGATVASTLYFGAHRIYSWYVPAEMVEAGAAFLRLQAMSVFLMFIFLGLVSFLRGLKNSKSPMRIFIFGAFVFVIFDYLLIFGLYGFPQMGLYGSAMASIIQYASMLVVAAGYILFHEKYRKYSIELFSVFKDKSYFKELILLSVPSVIDKATLALSYVWLLSLLKPLGSCCVASFSVIKEMERFALLPALACAQVITFLVSNDFGAQNWQGIKSNIKKIVFMASVMVCTILILFSYNVVWIINLFDKQGDFTHIAARIFPALSLFVFFDLLQVVLAGALRGAANVRTVMLVRLGICSLYFVPVSYLIAQLPIEDPAIKMTFIFGSFYIGNALMSAIYINRLRGEDWKMIPKS
jgi:putative MATE family efflux protein